MSKIVIGVGVSMVMGRSIRGSVGESVGRYVRRLRGGYEYGSIWTGRPRVARVGRRGDSLEGSSPAEPVSYTSRPHQ